MPIYSFSLVKVYKTEVHIRFQIGSPFLKVKLVILIHISALESFLDVNNFLAFEGKSIQHLLVSLWELKKKNKNRLNPREFLGSHTVEQLFGYRSQGQNQFTVQSKWSCVGVGTTRCPMVSANHSKERKTEKQLGEILGMVARQRLDKENWNL